MAFDKCIFKLTSHLRGWDIKQRMIEMFDDPMTWHIEDTDGTIIDSAEVINGIYLDWKAQFKKEPQRKARHAVHIVLSAKIGTTMPELHQLITAVLDLITEKFSGHQYFFSVKTSSPYPSVRLLIHCHNYVTKQQLHMPAGWADEMRYAWAEALNKNGIEAEA